jgi:hypothetical protein
MGSHNVIGRTSEAKMSVKVEGLGPKFLMKVSLSNTGSRPIVNARLIFSYSADMYCMGYVTCAISFIFYFIIFLPCLFIWCDVIWYVSVCLSVIQSTILSVFHRILILASNISILVQCVLFHVEWCALQSKARIFFCHTPAISVVSHISTSLFAYLFLLFIYPSMSWPLTTPTTTPLSLHITTTTTIHHTYIHTYIHTH